MEKLNLNKFVLDKTLGRYYICAKTHPLANSSTKVYRHRYIASLKVGRWLKSEEQVHHIDENKLNDEPDNLVVLTPSQHSRLHQTGSIEEKFNTCEKCGKDTKNKRFCSHQCSSSALIVTNITTKELEDLIWEYPYTKVGNILGISDNGVRKAAKRLKCQIPPRMFHNKSSQEKDIIRNNRNVA